MPQEQSLASFLHDFFDGKLEAIGIPLFAGERAELAAQDAVIGVIDVPIDDVAGAIGRRAQAHLPGKISDGANGLQILALE
jgi:hypothetical protein